MAHADLVLEGGGVKGTALVGAAAALAGFTDPYAFHRIAGTSAGAIVAGLLASGRSPANIKAVMDELDFSRFEDEKGFLSRVPLVGPAAGLLFHQGMYAGDFLHSWIRELLAEQGIHVWADLKEVDTASALPPSRRYKLVVIVSDVSLGRMLRLPWDYEALLGVDPDTASVADAIRASASVPFFFRPWTMPMKLPGARQKHIVCSDGGLLSNYPLSLFDRQDGQTPRWPTIGIKLSGEATIRSQDWNPENNNLQLAKSLLNTMMGARDRAYVSDPQASSRTIFVDTSNYRDADFQITGPDKQALYDLGLSGGRKFLATWDWEKWRAGDYSMRP